MPSEEVQYSYEYWDCQCGRKGLRGDVMVCPGCGHPRDEDIKFYRNQGPPQVITDEKQLERFKAGPDWVCSFCQELNPDLQTECRGCGHTRFKTDQDYFEHQASLVEKHPTHPKTKKSKNHLIVIVAAVLLMIFAGLSWWANRTQVVDYEVTAVHWQRSIPVQRYRSVVREDWQNDIHGDDVHRLWQSKQIRSYESRQVDTRIEHYTDTEQYQSGTRDETSTSYESLGNGAGKTVTTRRTVPVYSTRSVDKTRSVPVYADFPVYDTKVRYSAKEYALLNTASADGTDNTPSWPKIVLGAGVDRKPDREGNRGEVYYVTLTKSRPADIGPNVSTIRTSFQEFTTKFIRGRRINYLVNNLGKITGEPRAETAASD